MPEPKFTVDDVQINAKDAAESKIEHIYAKASQKYAVYRNSDKVAVQYADDDTLADKQRSTTAALSLLRSQINGLIDGWRKSRRSIFQMRARRYDGEVAAALIQCLEEGDSKNALVSLQNTKDDIFAERTSWGMSEYLLSASAAGAVAVVILFAIQRYVYPFATTAENIWLAAGAGTIGAFFSIAWNIRGRSILPNLRRRDNISDAVLRIVIGMIAAAVLLLLLSANLVGSLKIGDAPISGKEITWQVVLIIGFVAGFAERLVPGLLDKSLGGQTPAPAGPAQPASGVQPARGAAAAAAPQPAAAPHPAPLLQPVPATQPAAAE